MTPIVKWAGGKTRLLPELVKRMPQTYGKYFEPFAGGAALFFHVQPERATLSDVNLALVTTYNGVRDNVERVIANLRYHRAHHDRDYYYAMRERWNTFNPWTEVRIAAAFIYLNRTCFNGLYRVNRDGEFNVPMGRYKNPAICRPVELRQASELLQRAHIQWSGYAKATDGALEGDFVYFDPPYDNGWTGYSSDGFDWGAQEKLAKHAHELVQRGVHVMLSNHATRRVRKLYRELGFEIDRVTCARSINSNASGRGAVGELIIRGGYQ